MIVMLVMRIMIAIMQSDDAMRPPPVHLVISDATLESDENGCCLHKNVEEYRGEERFRTRTRISVKKGSKSSGMRSFREVDPRSFHLMLKVGSSGV